MNKVRQALIIDFRGRALAHEIRNKLVLEIDAPSLIMMTTASVRMSHYRKIGL